MERRSGARAFAFDPTRKAIVLVAGDKQGEDEARFYKALLKKANKRYDKHLASLNDQAAKGPGAKVKGPNRRDKKSATKADRRK